MGPIAQRLEQSAHNREVPGSNPGGPTKKIYSARRDPNNNLINFSLFSGIFMNETEYNRFINLVELDKEILELEDQLFYLKNEKALSLSSLDNLNKQLDFYQQKLNDLKKETHLIELEIKSLDAKEVEKNKKLNNASNPKEFFSLENEIKDIKNKKATFEEPLFLLWDKVEQAQIELADFLKNFPDKKSELEDSLVNIERRLEYNQKDLNSILLKRSEFEVGIDQEFLENYNSLKKQIKNPVVKLKNENCSACFHSLSKQDLQNIRNKKLIKCKNCYRLIYSQDLDKEKTI